MLETLLGGVFGGALRFAPEVLKFFDRKAERKHELALQDKALEVARFQAQNQQALAAINANVTYDANATQALVEGIKAQAVSTGIKWVDAVSALVRPIWTFWTLVLYSMVKWYTLFAESSTPVEFAARLAAAWGPDDQALVASIAAFWFADRSLRKK